MTTKITDGLVSIIQVGFVVGGMYAASNNFYTGRLIDRDELMNTEQSCRNSRTFVIKVEETDKRYVSGIPIPFTERELKVTETEVGCGYARVHSFGADEVRFVVAERELFPDGRVNVLWDPGNKYASTNPFPSGNYR